MDREQTEQERMASSRERGLAVSEPGRPRISAVLNTLNEESRLPYALRSVQDWVDEIVVVDMHSDDHTREIAQSFKAQVFLHERLKYVEPARAFALSHSIGDWILILDADELVPQPLSRRLQAIAISDEADAVNIPWRNYLLGSALGHTGWGPDQDKHVRFFRRGAVEARAGIHDGLHVVPGSRVLHLPAAEENAIVHFNYLDVTQFIDKLNRYTSAEAESALAMGDRGSPARAVRRGAREFMDRYLRRGGLRDGWRGFYLSALMAMYRLVTVAKMDELHRNGPRAAVEASYRDEAERWLAAYRDDSV
jgi:glycosyltransferase involved in cell wall biosynthesis